MVAAYSTFANEGVYRKPSIYIKIEDKSGGNLQPIPESHDVLNKDIAYAVIKLLEGVTEGGSGDRLRTTGGGGNDNRWTGYPYSLEIQQEKTGTTKTNLMVGSWEWS
jgi:penicillin-binding protein 1A